VVIEDSDADDGVHAAQGIIGGVHESLLVARFAQRGEAGGAAGVRRRATADWAISPAAATTAVATQ
jgi:hypothetical protein